MIHTGFRIEEDVLKQAKKKAGLIGLSRYFRTLIKMWLANEIKVTEADIISCATMATDPVIQGEWLREGQHLDLIGAFKADMREADDVAMQRAKVFVDSRATTIEHIGELMIPLANGAIQKSNILADLYDLATGQSGRTSDADITLFKNGGGAHLDLMTGREILKAWRSAQA